MKRSEEKIFQKNLLETASRNQVLRISQVLGVPPHTRTVVSKSASYYIEVALWCQRLNHHFPHFEGRATRNPKHSSNRQLGTHQNNQPALLREKPTKPLRREERPHSLNPPPLPNTVSRYENGGKCRSATRSRELTVGWVVPGKSAQLRRQYTKDDCLHFARSSQVSLRDVFVTAC